jgi:hypothetical protein
MRRSSQGLSAAEAQDSFASLAMAKWFSPQPRGRPR